MFVGKLKGVGKICQYSAVDGACSFGFAKVLSGEKSAEAAAAFLEHEVLPVYREAGIELKEMVVLRLHYPTAFRYRFYTSAGDDTSSRDRRRLDIRWHVAVRPHWYETADGRLHYVDEGPREAPRSSWRTATRRGVTSAATSSPRWSRPAIG